MFPNTNAWFASLREESRENLMLENKLHSSFREIQSLEERLARPLSPSFDKRFQNLMELENPPHPQRMHQSLLRSRPFQYGFSFALLICIFAVGVVRNTNQTQETMDSAGVVSQSQNFTNTNASVDFSESYRQRLLIDTLRRNPDSQPGIEALESYYRETGRTVAAKELHGLIEAAYPTP